MAQWLTELNEWWLFSLLLLSMQGAAEFGLRLAKSVRPNESEAKSEVAAIQGTVLGLLALLLGFTFAMATQRYEDRKQLLRDEANAIGTVGLRVQLMPVQQRAHFTQLLRNYTETRFTLQRIGYMPERLNECNAISGRLQNQMWKEAILAVEANPQSETIGLVVESLNDLIDMHGKQLASIRGRIPGAIFLLLYLVSVLALALTGYGLAPRRRQSVGLTLLLSLLVSAVIMLSVDLHRPTRGMVTVSMTGMEDARDGLVAAPP